MQQSKKQSQVSDSERLLTSCTASVLVHTSILLLLLLAALPSRPLVGVHTQLLAFEHHIADELHSVDVTILKPVAAAESGVTAAFRLAPAPVTIQSPLGTLPAGESSVATDQGGAGTPGDELKSVSFFGTQALGDRFVYVLDVSGSMSHGGGRRLGRAMDELLTSVNQLTREQTFHVLLFSSRTIRMFGANSKRPELLAASKLNKRRLEKWLGRIRSQGGTYPQDALHLALELKPDAVFFLSDGAFNRPSMRESARQKVIEAIKSGSNEGFRLLEPREVVLLANPEQIPIHSIAFEDPRSSKDMREISVLTGGEFRFVSAHTTDPSMFEERAAKRCLSLADSLRKHGKLSRAVRQYEKILTAYPHTEAARKVRRTHSALLAGSGS